MKKKLGIISCIVIFLSFFAVLSFNSSLFASSINLDTTAEFVQPITLTALSDINFSSNGDIGVAGTPSAITDFFSLNTFLGVMTYGGVFSGPGTGSLGLVQVDVPVGATVETSCSSTFTMSDGAGASISGTPTVTMTAGFAATPCLGVGTAIGTTVFPVAGTQFLVLGGTVTGDTAVNFVGGDYSTANAGGSNIEVLVVYQ